MIEISSYEIQQCESCLPFSLFKRKSGLVAASKKERSFKREIARGTKEIITRKTFYLEYKKVMRSGSERTRYFIVKSDDRHPIHWDWEETEIYRGAK